MCNSDIKGAGRNLWIGVLSRCVLLIGDKTLTKDKKVYVIGMEGLEEELREEGFGCLGGTVRFPAGKHSYPHNFTPGSCRQYLGTFRLVQVHPGP
jgi:hypothetical protein